MKKRLLTAAIAAVTVSLAFTGCAGGGNDAGSGGDEKPYIALISKGFQHQFWQAVKVGVEKAAKEFDVNATYEGPVAVAPNAPPVRLLAMERALLADRFKLKVHDEMRQLGVFDLVRSRADGRLGPRLVRSDGTCLPLPSTPAPIADFTPYCGVKRSTRGAMSAKGLPLSRFALLLSFVPDVQRIVRDRTGLEGAFDLDIEFAPTGGADAPDLPPITTALKEQLGLELRPATGSVSVIVIDSVEPPTPD